MIESLSDNDIIELAEVAAVCGQYEAQRKLLDAEVIKRCINLCDDPTGFVDALEDLEEA